MKKGHDTLVAVAKISELVTTTLETSEILRRVVAITAEIMKVDVCSIYLYDEKDDTLVLEATVGLNEDAVGRVHIKPGEGITGRAAKQGRAVSVSDVTQDKRNIYIPITGEEEYHSLLSVPLKFQNELIGVINLQTREPRTFQHHDRQLIKTIAHQVSGSIRNARLYESVLSANRELAHTQERLVQSEKMAALGRLASTLSHELRNPLAGLKGAAQLLLKKTYENDERKQYVDLIIAEVERLGRIVEDLLHFGRPRELQYRLIDANKIIEDILLLISQDMDLKGIKIHKRLSKLPFINADSDKFKQVVMNIILNALDAMPEGGELIVSSGVIRNEPEKTDIATFQFKDTGHGISHDVLEHVFEPFFTTKHTGVGLGLAVCKAIIEEHGGRISISSGRKIDSRETLVTIEIPINEMKKQLTK
ncbi:MAG TPA: GAF domain-containing protein [Anaerolineae bacterium]|nr:GAF domain-containing protein [Anaerolineae bacterium]